MKHLKRLCLVLILITFIMLIYEFMSPRSIAVNNIVGVYDEYSPDIKVYNLFTKINTDVNINNKIDTSKVGDKELNINFKYLFFNVNRKVKVSVIDNTAPVILLNGDINTKVCPSKKYIEEGYTASDNYDGDITDKVIVINHDNDILYSVNDKSNNSASIKRTINYIDDESPSITLNGNSDKYIYLGNSYKEEGATASDNCDGDITDKITISGEVNTNSIGTYKINYEVEDSESNKTSIERTVHVIRYTQNNYYGDGIIYLTFDDGPSGITGQILDILDSEGIKATFFVTGVNDYTIRAYNNGHTIALHTNSHDYSYIYSSIDNYFNDLNTVSDKVYNSLGIRSTIIRFPGGSSNTVSRHYSSGIMSNLTTEVENRGYSYYDWNVDSNDAGSDIYNSSNIYYNVINNLSHSKTNIVLMHDSGSHSATVNALRSIITFGKQNGYTFKAITSDTPAVHHGVSN